MGQGEPKKGIYLQAVTLNSEGFAELKFHKHFLLLFLCGIILGSFFAGSNGEKQT